MPIVGIDHVQLAMPAGAEDVARGFYQRVLGLPEQSKPPHLAKRGGCWFENELVKIHPAYYRVVVEEWIGANP